MDDENQDIENIPEDPSHRERLVKELHNKGKLPSLRTYQGDMAKYINEKNESVISIALKEKERREEQEKEEPRESKKEGFSINFPILIASLVLLVGSLAVLAYVFEFFGTKTEVSEVEITLIPFGNTVIINDATKTNFSSSLAGQNINDGASRYKIISNGRVISDTKTFFDFLEIKPPSILERSLSGKFELGVIVSREQNMRFLMFETDDFGMAFSGMLEWERKITEDLSFIADNGRQSPAGAEWKDIIIGNKDTRALVDPSGKALFAYTFLDKNNLVIVKDTKTISEVSKLFSARSFAR
jgi:hypothetical protein